jgi:hypothetical protein
MPVPIEHRKLSMLRSMAWLPLLLAAAIAALRLLPAPPSLDASIAGARAIPPALDATFPGSAFFTMEGAFEGLPRAPRPGDGGGVLRLEDAPAAPSTPLLGLTAIDRQRAANCLAAAVYYEAGRESADGQRAVAQVVLNRLRHPAWPHSVCEVVYQGSERTDRRCQFTFSCDGAMARVPGASWADARRIARAALAGTVFAPVGLATSYHSLAVRPAWAARLRPVAVVGAHVFYRLPGASGEAAAFTARYSGFERMAGPAAPVATAAVSAAGSVASPPAAASPVVPDPTRAQVGPPDLPPSTIRPEYRNTGRVRAQFAAEK